jgi:squalene-hopene/tetraprenyl-beta-curcumene cyclase
MMLPMSAARSLALAFASLLAACASAAAPTAPASTAVAPAAVIPHFPAPPSWQTRAAAYLDQRALDDVARPPRVDELEQNLDCTATCHTTQPYLLVRAALPGGEAALDRVRSSIEARVAAVTDWSTATPWFGKPGSKLAIRSLGAESVVEAVALAEGDLARRRPLSASSLRAMDLMWRHQRADGAWDWFDFHYEPWETGDDCGAALAASFVGELPAGERQRARPQVERLAAFVRGRLADAANPPKLHQKAVLLWASDRWSGLLDDASRRALAGELVARQRPDGGWSIATWGSGKLADPNGASDGYATAVATLALCEGGLDPASAKRGLDWLERSQRADGSWAGKSLNSDGKINALFEADMATAYAVLALTRCAR